MVDAEGLRADLQRAREYLDRSMEHGDALALQQRYLTRNLVYTDDAATAYAYLFAYSLTPGSAETVPALLAHALEEAAKGLDSATLEHARADARRLAACCGGTTGIPFPGTAS